MSGVKYEYQGAKGLVEISKLTGIPKPTLAARIRKFNLTVKEAVEYTHVRGKVIHKYKGFVGLTAIAREFGANYHTLRHRVEKMGLPIEVALTQESFQEGNRGQRAKNPEENGLLVNLSPLWALALGIKECA
ncbi:hypothetical protein [Vibrio parahaemolyticus]|uniref:Uncharacterized protein n=1 Tax=Vibrio parahaemolyticus TaxID=670 RepID=A0A9Q3UBC5_VIBPH|nr:hypothetical protein [Vibrio parahaemolyticus]EGQ9150176.1 hypothetical protein [Vibrio parahaemolyticus]MCC3804094.1 hypothetical protein [Vibrio parahaemolyticus]MDK9520127.1 hypothetical protein [Vibrio parahaemolyticus]